MSAAACAKAIIDARGLEEIGEMGEKNETVAKVLERRGVKKALVEIGERCSLIQNAVNTALIAEMRGVAED